MKPANNSQPQDKSIRGSADVKSENFDFEAWSTQVKRQMLDALSRRGLR